MSYLDTIHEYIANEAVCKILGIELPEKIEYYPEIDKFELPCPLEFLDTGMTYPNFPDFLGKCLQADRVEYLRAKLKTHDWQPCDIGIQEYTNGLGSYQLTWRSVEKFIPKETQL